MKKQTRQLIRQKKPARIAAPKPPSNTVEYRAVNGRHIVTLNLGEGVFSAVRAVAHAEEHSTPQAYILASVCRDVASMLTQLTDAEALAFVKWQGEQESPEQAPVEHEITLKLSAKAYAILLGVALAGNYDSPEEMILTHTSSFCSQSVVDGDEKEYAKMFGLVVAANGNTSLAG